MKTESVRKSFSATFSDPTWVTLIDYKLDIPDYYIEMSEIEESELGRTILPTSYTVTRFGKFMNELGEPVDVDGIIYQYAMLSNPRNVRHAFRLFAGEDMPVKKSEYLSLQEAKNCANSCAEKYIKENLFDLD